MPGEATYQIWTVSSIVVGSGLFGGWTAFLSDQAQHRSDTGHASSPSLVRYMALGLCATISVPLFLSLVQSALIPKIFNPEKVDGVVSVPYQEFLIFTGICIIASISSRKFLDTVSDLRDVSRLEETTKRIDKKAAAAEKTAEKAETVSLEVLDEREAKPRPEADSPELDFDSASPTDVSTTPSHIELSVLERKALSSLMEVTFRTASGIGQSIGVNRGQVAEILDSLSSKKLVERTTSPATGGPRWKITSRGVQTLNQTGAGHSLT